MARTQAGAALSIRHRQAQLALRSQALRDFTRLWPLWRGDERSFQALVAATIPLVNAHRKTSSSVASAYYESFRRIEGVKGSPTPRHAEPADRDALTSSLYVTGAVGVRKAIAAGFSPQAAMQTALTRTSGAVTRNVLNAGRETILGSGIADKQAQGWIRMTSGNPCAFCALLAGRGAVYSEGPADFSSHDHCSCFAEPAYEGSQLPAENQRFRDTYNRATANARAAGELERGTSNDLLNAFRREYTAAE